MALNPYYKDASVEPEVIDFVVTSIKERKDPNILFFVSKSWNRNVVVYEYVENSSEFVKPVWLSLEPEDAEAHRQKGNYSLKNDLNFAETSIFGVQLSNMPEGRFIIKMNQELLHNKVFELVMDSKGNPAIVGTVAGEMCRVQYAYAHMKKGSIPDVDYMNLYGISIKTGNTVVEKMINS